MRSVTSRLWLSSCVALLLVGCASTGSVWLKDARSGQVVECGPYFTPTHTYETPGYRKLKDCVSDYQAQGYVRTPEPAKK